MITTEKMTTSQWTADPAHSEIQFKVKHLMISTVTGYFTRFNLEVETEGEDFTRASHILFTADTDSTNTNNAQRDTHLMSADFFDAATHALRSWAGNLKKPGTATCCTATLRCVPPPGR